MKTILKFTVAMAFMFTTIVGMANEPKLYLVADKDAKSLVFQLDTQSQKTSIKFVDTDDHLIYSENILDESNYTKKFDLSKLKDGRYFLEMENSQRVITYTISIDKTNMEITGKKENTKPIFRRKGDMVYLNLLNLDQKGVEVKVYDSNSRVLFKEVFEGELLVEKAFNFEKAFEDEYTVVVKDSATTYYERVSID